MQAPFRLATAQYGISFLESWADYERKIERWVAEAAESEAKILVFPEYFSMELTSLFPKAAELSLSDQLTTLQDLKQDFLRLYETLAQRYNVTILTGTYPVQQNDGSYRNRSWLTAPDRATDFQDKLQMTRFENEVWGISSGNTVRVLDTAYGKIGVAICYDSEFPLIVRQQVENGAQLILVPSCTDTTAGYYRVRTGCQARALENQCYVIQSSLVGLADWSKATDINIGTAGIYTPMDYGCPDTGILAIGELNKPQWVYADIDLALMEKVRSSGQVFNHRDWDKQYPLVKTK